MIAAHVPPYSAGSGYLRTLKFCEYLPQFGWDPVVLAPANAAFADHDLDPETMTLMSCPVIRSFALDAARHLSIMGRYPDVLAVPDRWSSWWFSAVFAGLRLIREYRPAVIFSTYPISTAHLIGLTLARLTGIPWVADFRDPMIEDKYPPPGMARRARGLIERSAVKRCAAALFTTAGTLDYYRGRFPGAAAEKMHLLMNGYDERDFLAAEAAAASRRSSSHKAENRPLELLHSGSLDPDFRNPSALFRALAELKREGVISAGSLRVRLLACGRDSRYRQMTIDEGIDDIVSIEPGVSYLESLTDMRAADGLILMQGADANMQVPAKLFEYFRAGSPILGLLHADGDTAQILRETGVGRIARMDDSSDIKAALREFVSGPDERCRWATPLSTAEAFSRQVSASRLSRILDKISDKRVPAA